MKKIILPGGDLLCHDEQATVVEMAGPRRVLSTSFLNGGFREDLRTFFNFSEVYGVPDERCEMRAPTNEGHLRLIAEELGLNPAESAGLSTAAKMKYVQVKSAAFDDFKLTAVATAGIDVSGSRVGDPSAWHEKEGVPVPAEAGTINIILHTDALLTPGAMARALSVCTEAKTAALQEVLAQSCFSTALATGSGTDGIAVISCLDSGVQLANAGSHVKLGEWIGRLVKETVIAALVAENGFDSYARGSLLKRVSRFGISKESLRECYLQQQRPVGATGAWLEDFEQHFRLINDNEELILQVTLYGHLYDLLQWHLADPADVAAEANQLLNKIASGQNAIRLSTGFKNKTGPEQAEEMIKTLAAALVIPGTGRQA
jgi:adenosylcobinamide amidohydrolase